MSSTGYWDTDFNEHQVMSRYLPVSVNYSSRKTFPEATHMTTNAWIFAVGPNAEL